ncbi:DUF1206 domain-containing protein [Nocardioides sp.]|uniref:DUF1206 domain-containing protein n=1 Tax=Nocardioides sp. TaxID=35761 RepID=UPI0026085E02|nr:DUF1206 domain-containing protein [Nocardioides sp.]
MDTNDVTRVARRAGNHDALTGAARVGFVVNGLLHLLIGWIALQVAFGGHRSGNGKADQSGALSTLADNTLGHVLLWVAVAGFLGLALWQLTETITGAELGDKIKAGAKTVVYLAVGWTALTFARGGSSSSGRQSRTFTARLLDAPMGVVLVVVIGLAVVAVGAYHVYKGVTTGFLDELTEHPGLTVVRLGQVGYVAKGVALAVVGCLFVGAALRHDPHEASGLDGALRTLREAPAGQALLAVVAVGLMAYGLFSFARARYARL